MARLGATGLGLIPPLLTIGRGRLGGGARGLWRTLQPQHQLNQLFLAQTFKIAAAHPSRESANPASRKGLGNYTLVILDGLFVAQDAASGEQEFRKFVHELQGTAAITGAAMLLLTNQRRDPSSPEYTMVDGWIELYDETDGYRAVRSLAVHKQRGGSFLRGRNSFRITDAGIVVFPRIEAALAHTVPEDETEERIASGAAGIDTMLQGGYPALSATLLYGPTGAGKTTLGLQFIGQCTPEAPGLIYGFYESPKRLQTKAASIGIDLADLVRRGAVEIHWRTPAENLVDEVCYTIIDAVERTNARRVFVDGLGAFRTSLLFSKRLPLIVNALNHRLRAIGATVVYTLENSKLFLPEDLKTDDLSSIVDNVILLHYASRQGLLRRNISILKVRDSDFDPISEEFHITDRGLTFGEQAPQQRPEGALVDTWNDGETQHVLTHPSGTPKE
jgi:circadian clock protein KaiC